MAVVAISDSILTDIADAIRSKNGTENTYKPSQMPDAIEAISSGGITPTGTIEITQNGVVDVTNYASADVDVPQGITPTGTKQISITENGTTTEDVTNYASAEISVNVPSSGGSSMVSGTYVFQSRASSFTVPCDLETIHGIVVVPTSETPEKSNGKTIVGVIIVPNVYLKSWLIKTNNSGAGHGVGPTLDLTVKGYSLSNGNITISSGDTSYYYEAIEYSYWIW